MRCVAMVINSDKPVAAEAAQGIVRWLEHRSLQPILPPEGARLIGRPDLVVGSGDHWAATADVVVVLGGDGTLIRTAKWAAPLRLPILGINMGHLGFLTELEHGELFTHLEALLTDAATIEERLMLSIAVERNGEHIDSAVALNEAFVGKGPGARIVGMAVSIGDTTIAEYRADGLIVATPTGSTAYSLSAGGPIVSPTVDALLITPVCPHTMSARPIVVDGSAEILITLLECHGEMGLSVDGADLLPLQQGDLVRVRRAPHAVRLIRRYPNRFYEILEHKLAENGR